jgi:hypothetical protein
MPIYEIRRAARIDSTVKRILVPIDLMNGSERPIEFGLVLAKLFEAPDTVSCIPTALGSRIFTWPLRIRCCVTEPAVFRERSEFDRRKSNQPIRRLRYRVP